MAKRLCITAVSPFSQLRAVSLLACLAVALCLFLPSPAAAGYGYDPNNAANIKGNDLQVDTFTCDDPSATLFINESCTFDTEGLTEQVLGVFAQVVCRVENIFGTIASRVYCSVQEAILQPFLALLTLYVTIYGVTVILGLKRATFNDAILHVAKMGLVAAIALNAEVGIQIGYKFFIQVAQTSGEVIFSAFDSTGTQARMANYDEMVQKGYLASRNISATDIEKAGRGTPEYGSHWMQHLDGTLNRIINFFVEGGIGFVYVLGALLIFFPPLFVVVVYLIYSAIKMLSQAIIGYMLALLGITFLFVMAPIFVSFALFKVTSSYFEEWLKHLIGFSLQMIVIFTMLMFVVALDLVGFFQQIGGMIRQYHYHLDFYFFHMGLDPLTLCRVERGTPGDREGRVGPIIYYRFTLDGELGTNSTGTRYDGFPQCVKEYKFDEVLAGTDSLPGLPASDKDELINLLNDIRDSWNEDEQGPKPADAMAVLRALVDKENNKLRYSVTELFQAADLMYFLLVRFLAVAVLTYLLDQFAKKVPLMATRLTSRTTYGRLMPAEGAPSAGLQDDPRHSVASLDQRFGGNPYPNKTNWAGGSYGMLNYKRYVRDHKHDSFREGFSARKAHLDKTKGQGFFKRRVLGEALGFGTMARGIVANRFHDVAGVVPAARGMARDMTYRTLMTGASLGRGTAEKELVHMRRQLNLYEGNMLNGTQPQQPATHQHPHHHSPGLGRKRPRKRFLF